MEINSLLYLILMVIIGYMAMKWKLISNSVDDGLPDLLMNICYPAIIVHTFHDLELEFLLSSGITLVLTSTIVMAVLFVGGNIILKKMEARKRALINLNIGVGNVTYVGLPVVSIFFGEIGVTIAILVNVIIDLFVWPLYYPAFIGKKADIKSHFLKNPCIIALIIGVFLTLTQFKLPSVMYLTIESLGGLTSPLALLFLGITMYKYGLLNWIKDKTAISVSIVKVIIMPVVLYFIFISFLSFHHTIILCALFACPASVMSIIWAKAYDNHVELAVNTCICSTLLYLLVVTTFLSIISYIGLL